MGLKIGRQTSLIKTNRLMTKLTFSKPLRTKVDLNYSRPGNGFSEIREGLACHCSIMAKVSSESVFRAVTRDEPTTVCWVYEHMHDRLSVHCTRHCEHDTGATLVLVQPL